MKSDGSKIIPMPEIEQEILDAIDEHKLLIFVGAGLSCLFGYPLWGEFGNKLIDECIKQNFLSYSDKKTLNSGHFSPMKIVTIAYKELENNLGKDKAREITIKNLCAKKENKKLIEEVAILLSHYGAKIITTNADLSLDKTISFSEKQIIDDFIKEKIDSNRLYYSDLVHIHGSIKDFNSMVFTSEQYAKAYMPNTFFGENIIDLLKDKTVLFIGYGVNEFELIKYFLNSNLGDEKSEKKTLFILNGYLDCEEFERKFDEEYYDSIGIKLLPFSRETNDYDALIDVLRKWDEEITGKTLAHLNVSDKIKNAFNCPPNEASEKYVKGALKNE